MCVAEDGGGGGELLLQCECGARWEGERMDGCREGSLLQDNYKVINAFGSYGQTNHSPFRMSFVKKHGNQRIPL